MTISETPTKKGFRPVDHTTWQWKLFLIYDVVMMILIVINLLTLAIQALILSDFGTWLANITQFSTQRIEYIKVWDPIIRTIDFYFICYLILELIVRWITAIIAQHHHRWWFFPFIHWYEVLAIIPQLRFLRLLRAGVIAFRLHELGYKIIPKNMGKTFKFYYEMLMEELTSRIVLTVIRQIEKELDSSTTHHQLIHNIIDHHRIMFAQTLAATLQQSLAIALAKQQQNISENIGQIVHQAIDNTPELTQLLRLLPIVGSRLENQIQAIGQRLGENITQGIIHPFIDDVPQHSSLANPLLNQIAQQVSQASLPSKELDQLIDSIVRESLEAIKQQVKIKQWQQLMDTKTQEK